MVPIADEGAPVEGVSPRDLRLQLTEMGQVLAAERVSPRDLRLQLTEMGQVLGAEGGAEGAAAAVHGSLQRMCLQLHALASPRVAAFAALASPRGGAASDSIGGGGGRVGGVSVGGGWDAGLEAVEGVVEEELDGFNPWLTEDGAEGALSLGGGMGGDDGGGAAGLPLSPLDAASSPAAAYAAAFGGGAGGWQGLGSGGGAGAVPLFRPFPSEGSERAALHDNLLDTSPRDDDDAPDGAASQGAKPAKTLDIAGAACGGGRLVAGLPTALLQGCGPAGQHAQQQEQQHMRPMPSSRLGDFARSLSTSPDPFSPPAHLGAYPSSAVPPPVLPFGVDREAGPMQQQQQQQRQVQQQRTDGFGGDALPVRGGSLGSLDACSSDSGAPDMHPVTAAATAFWEPDAQ
jgi:hypothetical protein